jgi:UDP-2,3-diacylglucosamine hydrolase
MNAGRTKYYFASDFHLGADAKLTSKERERLVVAWIDEVKQDAKEIYFMGDIFDHWFEYAQVVPKGFNLFLGKLEQLQMEGIPVFFFTGNHDMWMSNYFTREFGVHLVREKLVKEIGTKRFYLCHGHGLPTSGFADRMMHKAFSNPILQWLFARFHPNFAIWLMKYFSHKSRLSHGYEDMRFNQHTDKMIGYARDIIKNQPELDFIIMGHRHLPIDLSMENGKTRYINLGDWVSMFSYGVFDGENFNIKFFRDEHRIFP